MSTELDIAKMMFGWANKPTKSMSSATVRYGVVESVNTNGSVSVKLDDTGAVVIVRTDTPVDVGDRVTIVMQNGQYLVYSVQKISRQITEQGQEIIEFVQALGDLGNQIDGKVDVHYEDYTPTASNLPASEWTDEEKQSHTGDLFYNTVNGYCYRWTGTAWEQITDDRIEDALNAAQNAETAADGKAQIFTTTPKPPYQKGDLWVQGSGGDIKVCNVTRETGSYVSSDWVLASSYTDDTNLNLLIDSFSLTSQRATVTKQFVNAGQSGYTTPTVNTTYWYVFEPDGGVNKPIIAYASIPIDNVSTRRYNEGIWLSDYEFTITWPTAFTSQGISTTILPLSSVTASPHADLAGAFSYNRTTTTLGPLVLWRPNDNTTAMTSCRMEIIAMFRVR